MLERTSSLANKALAVLALAAAVLVAVCVMGARPAYAAGNAYAVLDTTSGVVTITHDTTTHEAGSTGTSTQVPTLSGTWYPIDETTTGRNTLIGQESDANTAGYQRAQTVTKVVFDDTCDPAQGGQYIQPKSTASMFSELRNMTEIDHLDRLDPSQVVNSYETFYMCEKLTSLDITRWSSNQSTNMQLMFFGCTAVTDIEGLADLDTSHVTTMRQMFRCPSLQSLDVSRWNTSNVTDMDMMFEDCASLTDIVGLNDMDTSNVTDFGGMFFECSGLTSLAPTFSMASATDVASMFAYCTNLTTVDISHMDLSSSSANSIYMDSMFENCPKLTNIIGLAQLDVSKANGRYASLRSMFQDCSSLPDSVVAAVNSWDTSQVESFQSMFEGCSSLTDFTPAFSTAASTDMSSMFKGCSGLTSLDLDGFTTGNVAGMSSMFEGCSSLTALDVSGFDTGKVSDMSRMFARCSSLPYLDLSSFNPHNAYSFENMFRGCTSLAKVDGLQNWDTTNASEFGWMFGGCSSLAKLDLSSFNPTYPSNLEGMFRGCTNLVDLDVSNMSSSRASMLGNMFSAADPQDPYDTYDPDNTGDLGSDLAGVADTPLHRLVLGPNWSFSGQTSWAPTQTTVLVTPDTGFEVGPDGKYHDYTGKWAMDAPTSDTQLTSDQLIAAYQAGSYDSDGNPVQNDYNGTHAWVWSERELSYIHYDANDGTGSMDDTPAPQGGTGTVAQNAFARDGYTFAGWNTAADGSGTSYRPGDTISFGDDGAATVTLYAQWSPVPPEPGQGGQQEQQTGGTNPGGSGALNAGNPDEGAPAGEDADVDSGDGEGTPSTNDAAPLAGLAALLTVASASAVAAAAARRKARSDR